MLPAAAVLVTLAIGCHKQAPVEVQELRWLETADPIADARTAMAKGDHRLRAVYGLSVSIPGTDRKDFDTFKQIYGINEIEGTTDSLHDEEHGRLVLMAVKYAETYNQHIISAYKPQVHP